ncbi:glycosyltransferase [Pseudomonas sp. TNT2022 ID1044]|uniref:glycosyltransferase n=1 Tax=Pseudomonas sp. TNT2022 ID1044 TaxID=2942636 RepID=UPI002361EABF|nr:glycosyltransferase [Pseudomonas sp. TNT2022 ID1044]MDD0998603.1 glycosyltransferase [Pseudomonas sp. TNT2022 ID1044]
MSIKNYGIYLAYAPGLDLRHEGLGRYLAAFLKGAGHREDVRFVLVCPSWSKEGLEDLFKSEGVPKDRFEVVSPAKKPMILRVYEAYVARKKRKRGPGLIKKLSNGFLKVQTAVADYVMHRLVTTNNYSGLLLLLFEGILLACVIGLLSPIIVVGLFIQLLIRMKFIARRLMRPLRRYSSRAQVAVSEPKDNAFIFRLYKVMERIESERMLQLIDNLVDVKAWYSPTAFWPAFNKINRPRLMCVPDVVLSDFPVGFSNVGGERFFQTYEDVRKSIQTGQHYVTYSNAIKWETLVDQYSIRASDVSVIHHAPNKLNQWVTTRGFADLEATSLHYAQTLLASAMRKSSNKNYTVGFANTSFKFLFYASQFRPNKNLLMLMRAYEFLLRKKYISHKLILTGDPERYPAVKKFIEEHNLENDVLCLHGLSVQELAACYKLADLAVNPSLSEGGCPFTFTEALSVDTPVVMARIPVTEEILNQPELQDTTYFDPYDWEDMAHRIEWALSHREELLVQQKEIYQCLIQRTWTDVVNEHIAVLESISVGGDQPSGAHL